jgi:hypothetical protein
MPEPTQLDLLEPDAPRIIRDCDAALAMSVITENSLPKAQGFRHLFVGYPGCGKTQANAVLFEFVKRYNVCPIATDQKSIVSPYPAELIITNESQLSTLDDIRKGVIIRGFGANLNASDFINFDTLARDLFRVAKSGTRVALFVDELSDACQGEKSWAAPKGAMPWMTIAYKQGREIGFSLSACTQLPQEITRAAWRLSDTVGYFRLEGGEIRYLLSLNLISMEDARILETLPDFTFLLFRRGDSRRYLCKM